jgi:hypothetical protein
MKEAGNQKMGFFQPQISRIDAGSGWALASDEFLSLLPEQLKSPERGGARARFRIKIPRHDSIGVGR